MKNDNEMKVMKDGALQDRQYFFGMPSGKYIEVLDAFTGTRVNSCETSSLPLVEFWQPENLPQLETFLGKYLVDLDLETGLKVFECPTVPKRKGRVLGPASMTDLMIIDNNWQIAIEAKYTEYVWGPCQTLGEWLVEKLSGAGIFLRRTIAKAWIDMIGSATCTELDSPNRYSKNCDFYTTCGTVGYQFLHRTASACLGTNGPEGSKPVLVYQLFYKQGDDAHIAKMEAFKDQLCDWAELLKLKNMTFLIMSVPVTNASDVIAKYDGRKADLFEEMKMRTIYTFDFDGLEIEKVL
jgi:hypothetical protein